MKKKVVCYCRVSTGSKEQYNSFENQKQFFEKYIKEHPEYELYKSNDCPTGIYADRGISGTLLKREQFDKMLENAGLIIERVDYRDIPKRDIDFNDILITYRDYVVKFSKEKPKYEYILVKNTSRFSRNIMIIDILRKLKSIGVYVKFLDIDKTTEEESDFTIIQFFQTFDEMYSRDLSRKLLAANQQSRENQILRTNYDLYGYNYHKRRSRAENNYLTIVPEEAIIIQMVYRLYLGCFYVSPYDFDIEPPKMDACDFKCSECSILPTLPKTAGIGFRNIRMILNEIYHLTTRKGGEFTNSSLRHIFEQEKYAGYLNNGKWYHGDLFNPQSVKIREDYKENMVYRPDIIPPIISMELFQLCQEKKEGKADKLGHFFRGKPSEYKGLLYCGTCGSVMTHNTATNGEGLYNCRIKKTKGKKFCDNGNIYTYQFKDALKELCDGGITDYINKKSINLFDTVCDMIGKKIADIEKTKRIDRIKELSDKIEEKSATLTNLYTLSASPTADKTSLQKAISPIEEELPNLRSEYDKLTKKPLAYLQECEDLLSICLDIIEEIENAKTVYTDDELLEVVDRFMIYSETNSIRGGLHGAPKVSVVPILKAESQLSTKYNLEINPVAKNSIITIGFEDDKNNFIIQLKKRYEDLKSIVEEHKSSY